ncbi:MAG TPA: acyl-CoA dehydrogenase family protein [Candidatus Limnocylindria bacterium]|nr:acyl-CoA dehydrogenase family protein [Candidatus Limnocylindria bacterium]
MHFGPNDEQRDLQRSARAFFSRELPSERLRRGLDGGVFERDLWTSAARLGWIGALVPERHGGSGLVLGDLTMVLEEAGRAIAPLPLLETAVVGALAIGSAAVPARADGWLSALAGGTLIVAMGPFHLPNDRPAMPVSARRDGESWLVDGSTPIVPFGADADLVLTFAQTADGPTLFAVPAESAGFGAAPVDLADRTARAASVEYHDVRVPRDHVLGAPGAGWTVLEPVIRAARAALCADMVGGAQRAIELSVEYAKQRVQFDRPIGSFQAVKHKLADMQLALEGMRGLAYAAASAAGSHGSDDPIVEVAKAVCNDGYRMIASEAIQVHGGIGFTWDHDLHFYYKRALRLRATLGASSELYHSIGTSLLAGRGFVSYDEPRTAAPAT